MIKFDVLNHWTLKVQFTAEIDCAEDAPASVKAVLSGADLRGADLSGADLRGAVLSGALKGAPVVPHIDAAILRAIDAGGKLDMDVWHKCETTHCRAGWAVTLAGDAGAALELAIGPAAAGSLIYVASRPGQKVPNFYAGTEETLEDIKAGAAADPLPVEG